MPKLRFSVIGAGPGGTSMAVMLKKNGCSVKLYDNNKELIKNLQLKKKIKLTGKIEAEESLDVITYRLEEAMENIDAVMICTTTNQHRNVIENIARFLKDGQIIVLNPGHTGGALEVRKVLAEQKCNVLLYVAETVDLIYACRLEEVGTVFHSGLKTAMKLAALPAKDTEYVIETLKPYLPHFYPGENVLETSLENLGALLHPIPTLMNLNKMDKGVSWDYYMEGITPSIAKIIEQADKEKMEVAKALGLNVRSLVDSLKNTYKLEAENLYDLIQSNNAYVGVKSPQVLNHRFITEDTLCGTVTIASMGKELSVPTPIMDAFVEIASSVLGRDFGVEGRTAKKLGLEGKTVAEIKEMVN